VLQYLQNVEVNQVAVILKVREPARIPVAIGGENNDSPHLDGRREHEGRWQPFS
jgi:hypothetical protein